MAENDASTPSECKAIIKKTGQKCTMTAKYGDFCGVHKPRPKAVPKTTPKPKAATTPRANSILKASNAAALEISLLAASVIEALSNANPLIPVTKTKAEIEQLLKILASSKPSNDIESQRVKNATDVLAKVLSQFDPLIGEDGGTALSGSRDKAENGESKPKGSDKKSANKKVIDLKQKKDAKKSKKDKAKGKTKTKSSKDKKDKKDKKKDGGKKKGKK